MIENLEAAVWLRPPLVPAATEEEIAGWVIEEYDPEAHDITPLAAEQAWAVATQQARMLTWELDGELLVMPQELTCFVAKLGSGVVVAAAGFNALYNETATSPPTAELGGAYIAENFRGIGMYVPLIEARKRHASLHSNRLIAFANDKSGPILTAHGFMVALPEEVPSQAFELCLKCNANPQPGTIPVMQACCDSEAILIWKPDHE